MAMSVLLRSPCRAGVAAAISNVCRYTTISRAPLRLLENRNVTQLIAPIPKCVGARQFAVTKVMRSSNHSKLWTIERGFSAALLAIIPAAIAFPSKTLDTLMAVTMVMHAHWGLEACAVDYVRPVLFGPVLPRLAPLAVAAFSATLLAVLVYFIQTDIGIAQTIRKLWAIQGK